MTEPTLAQQLDAELASMLGSDPATDKRVTDARELLARLAAEVANPDLLDLTRAAREAGRYLTNEETVAYSRVHKKGER